NGASGDRAGGARPRRPDHGLVPARGLPMAAGRNSSGEEDQPNGPSAVALSHGFWTRHYGGAPGAVGSTLQVEGRAVPIVGVLPPDFLGDVDFDQIGRAHV